MLAYSYDEETKEYLESYELSIDPLESKKQNKIVYAGPRVNSTIIEPLESKTNKAVIFNIEDKCWEYIQDYRGKKAYNDEGLKIIDYLGKLKGSDKLLTKKQIEGLEDGSLIWKDGEIIPNPGPSIQEQIAELEEQIEEINVKLVRDMIILQDPNATTEDKQEAQRYFNNKVSQKQELVDRINELKNQLAE